MENKKIKVFMGLPSNGSVVDSQAYLLRELADRYSDKIELVYPPVLVQRIFHDAAREGIVQDFLASDCDVLWFLDSDVTPPRHTLDLITMHWDKWKCAGAAYPIFLGLGDGGGRKILFTAYKGTNGKALKPTAVPNDGQEFVDGLATGCLFIKREVFEQLERPYFEFKYDPISRAPIEGEDLGFCMKVNALGIKFFTDYSMLCKHQKHVDLLEMNNYAVEWANSKVLAYDAAIRGSVQAAVSASFKKGVVEGMARAESTPPPKPKSSLVLPDHYKV